MLSGKWRPSSLGLNVLIPPHPYTVYPKKYTHGFVVLCFVVVMQSFIMNSHEIFIHIHQGCFAGTGAIVRLPQCQWSKPDGYGKISQCITTTKHSKAKTVCIFLGIYCRTNHMIDFAVLHTMPQKCWFIYTATGRQLVHVQAQPNPKSKYERNHACGSWCCV